MLTIIDGRRAVADMNATDLTDTRAAIADPANGPANLASDASVMRNPAAASAPAHVNDLLRSAADAFEARAHDILVDEGTAADHTLAATTGC
jgi:hypothetical protein